MKEIMINHLKKKNMTHFMMFFMALCVLMIVDAF